MATFRNLPTSQKIAFPIAIIAVALLWPSEQDASSRPSVSKVKMLEASEPTIIDGDTIEISGERIRIVGIDAPDRPFVAKELAASQLIALSEREGGIRCEEPVRALAACSSPPESYGRRNLQCRFASGRDVAATMIAHGYAVDYRRYSSGEFAELTRDAAAQGKGLWPRFSAEMSALANERGVGCIALPGE